MPVKQKERNELRKGAKAHRVIADLADDPNVLAALDELTDSPAERNKAAADPTQWVKDKKIKIPQGAKAFFDENNWAVGLSFEIEGTSYQVGYSSDTGWFTSKS